MSIYRWYEIMPNQNLHSKMSGRTSFLRDGWIKGQMNGQMVIIPCSIGYRSLQGQCQKTVRGQNWSGIPYCTLSQALLRPSEGPRSPLMLLEALSDSPRLPETPYAFLTPFEAL